MADGGEMKVTKIQFMNQGFIDVLNSKGCQDVVYENTQRIAEEANANNMRGGEGFGYRIEKGSVAKRYLGFVYAKDNDANIAESEDKSLTRAVHE